MMASNDLADSRSRSSSPSSSNASMKPIRSMDNTPHTSPRTRGLGLGLDDLLSPTGSSSARDDDFTDLSLDEDSLRFSSIPLGTPPITESTPSGKTIPLSSHKQPRPISTASGKVQYRTSNTPGPSPSTRPLQLLSNGLKPLNLSMRSPAKAKGKALTPEAPTPATVPFMLARLDIQKEQLESDPKAQRISVDGQSRLREDFQRLQEGQIQVKVVNGDVEEPPEPPVTGSIDWDFWGAVMADYELVARTQSKKLAVAIEKGVPSALRGMVWQLMSASKDVSLEQAYSGHLKEHCPHEKAIQRDINRTFPNHAFFIDGHIGQENLYNVLKAYSLYDPEVGYCQGLAFIVAALLLNMPDEEAFCVLVRLMYSYGLRSMFLPEMPGLQLRLFQFDRLVEELLPVLFLHFTRQGVKSSMYCSQWFLTMFSYRFPLDMVFRIFDCVLANGIEAIFGFSIVLLEKNEEQLLAIKFDQILEYLKMALFDTYRIERVDEGELGRGLGGPMSPNTEMDMAVRDITNGASKSKSKQARSINIVSPATAISSGVSGEEDGEAEVARPSYDVDRFVQDAFQVKVSPFMLDSYGAEWEDLRRAANKHAMEMDGLRNANRQLTAQVKQLQGSLVHLEEDHCELVKQLVLTKVERDEMEGELVKYKILYAELMHQSEDAQLSNRMSGRISKMTSFPRS